VREEDEQIGNSIKEFASESAASLCQPTKVVRCQDREICATKTFMWVWCDHLVHTHEVIKDDGEDVNYIMVHGEADGSS
jgi:hypothetical protein